MRPNSFPAREVLASLPTPLQRMARFSDRLGIDLWIKRDDLTGMELTGNKVRKLEYLFAEAKKKKATCLVTCGGVQSNHCRAVAALAAKEGLRCVVFLRGDKPEVDWGNFHLMQLFGAEVFFLTPQQYYEEMPELRQMIESQIRAQGGTAYFIPEGGSGALGTFGYAKAYEEISSQGQFDSIVVANGSGGTQAGLLLGRLLDGKEPSPKIFGVNVCYDEKESFRRVKDCLWQAIQYQRLPLSFFSDEIQILDGFRGPAYAALVSEERHLSAQVAKDEGILLDPVYTGKAFWGFVDTLKNQPNYFGERVLFLHTGGVFGALSPLQERVK